MGTQNTGTTQAYKAPLLSLLRAYVCTSRCLSACCSRALIPHFDSQGLRRFFQVHIPCKIECFQPTLLDSLHEHECGSFIGNITWMSLQA